MNKNKHNNITLIGMPTVGKSVLGKKLAKKLGYRFLDLDKIIENKLGLSIPKIINKFGEKGFSEIEESVVLELGHINNFVISPGGSIVYSKKAMTFLRKISKIIFLYAPFEVIESRLSSSRKRKIIGLDNGNFKELYNKRDHLYRKYADIIIEIPNDLNDEKFLDKLSLML